MSRNKFSKTEVAIIILIFVLYGLAIIWCYKPSKKPITERAIKQEYVYVSVKKTRGATPKSLPENWPLDVKHQDAIKKQMQELGCRGINSDFDEASYYQDHYDDYQDDPEDEIRFPLEIFDANDD